MRKSGRNVGRPCVCTVDVAAVLAEELQGVGVVVLHRLGHVDDDCVSVVIPERSTGLFRYRTHTFWKDSRPCSVSPEVNYPSV